MARALRRQVVVEREEGPMKRELERLIRVHRIIGLQNYQKYLDSLEEAFVQRYLINMLTKKRDYYIWDHRNTFCRMCKMDDEDCSLSLSVLLALKEVVTREVEDAKQRILEFSSQTMHTFHLLCRKRSEYSNYVRSRQASIPVMARILFFEERNEHANQKYGMMLKKGQILRDSVNHFVIVRAIYTKVHREIEKEWRSGIKIIEDLMTKANESYMDDFKYRERAEVIRFQIKNTKEKTRNEINKFTIILIQDKILRDFMEKRHFDRKAEEFLLLEKQREKGIKGSRDVIEKYADTYEKIKTVSDLMSSRAISQKFLQLEDENFSLYAFINEQNLLTIELEKDIENLSKQIVTLENDSNVASLKEIEETNLLHEKLHSLQDEADDAEDILGDEKASVDYLVKNVKRIFLKTKAYKEPLAKTLGAGNVRPQNVLNYMGVVEHRLVELLTLYEYKKYKALVQSGHLKTTPDYSLPKEKVEQPLTTKEPRSLGEEYISQIPKVVVHATRPLSMTTLNKTAMIKLKYSESKSIEELETSATSHHPSPSPPETKASP